MHVFSWKSCSTGGKERRDGIFKAFWVQEGTSLIRIRDPGSYSCDFGKEDPCSRKLCKPGLNKGRSLENMCHADLVSHCAVQVPSFDCTSFPGCLLYLEGFDSYKRLPAVFICLRSTDEVVNPSVQCWDYSKQQSATAFLSSPPFKNTVNKAE